RVEGKILVEIKAKVDTSIARATAKIAFNYMTKEAGVKFALDASFDPLRQFIRYGEGGDNWRQFVRIVSKPLLAEETEDLQVTRGHVLILGWHDFDTLETYVSPYNSMAYRVTLTRSYRGIWQPVCGELLIFKQNQQFASDRSKGSKRSGKSDLILAI